MTAWDISTFFLIAIAIPTAIMGSGVLYGKQHAYTGWDPAGMIETGDNND